MEATGNNRPVVPPVIVEDIHFAEYRYTAVLLDIRVVRSRRIHHILVQLRRGDFDRGSFTEEAAGRIAREAADGLHGHFSGDVARQSIMESLMRF